MNFGIADLFISFEGLLFNEIADKDAAVKSRNVSKYLRAYDVFQINRFEIMYPYLIQLCTDTPLDCQLTVDVLRTLCDTNAKKLSAFHLIPSEASLITLLRHAQTMRFNFWGMWTMEPLNTSEFDPLALELDFIHYFMAVGVNPEYSRILLKFGFPYKVNLAESNNRRFFLENLRYDERPVVRTLQPLFEQALGGQKTRVMLIMDTFTIFGEFIRTGDFEDCVQTLVCLTRCLPEPYVTPFELYSTMEKVVEPEFLPHLHAIAQKYSNADIFEHKHRTYSPRRLMHFCRVVIRKRLGRNFKLLNGIETLNIPELIKSYLELEC